MSVLMLPPRSPALTPFVASLQYVESEMEATLERILPSGRIDLMVNLHEDEFRTYTGADCSIVRRTNGAVLGGPHSQASVIDTKLQPCLVMVDFRLGGASPFFSSPLSEAANQLVELDQFWGGDGRMLRERVLEARTPETKLQVLETVLLDRLLRWQEPCRAISFAASALERGVPVAEVASALGLLPKTFVRRFRKQMGLSPKCFSRVRRLQRMLPSAGDPATSDWAGLAAEHGYTDQSHLVHDFRDLTGLTPTEYRPRTVGEHNHVPVNVSLK